MPGKGPIKVVLFDMDDVLVDVSRSYCRAIEETAAHFTGRLIESGTVQRYKNQGGFNDDWNLTHAIISDAGMNVPFSRIVEEFQRRYRGENWNGFIAEEPPLISLCTLERLCAEDRVLGIVTARPEAEARWTLHRFGWRRYFPLIVAREKLEGRGKPDPFPLRHALGIFDAAGFKVKPEETVYVGDTVDDMAAARAAGIWAVGFVPPYMNPASQPILLRERGAHVVLTDLDELPDLLDRFGDNVAVEAAVDKT